MPSFGAWLKEVTPTWQWDWPHLALTRTVLDRVLSGELRKVMISMPPRHGKTEQNTVRLPVYCLERDPAFRVIVWAYNQTYAEKVSRKARRIAKARFELSKERSAASDWETTAGGGVRASGVGVGVTGMGANLVLIDDPVKSREEADSEAYRERVWESYLDDLYTRLEPGGAIVLTMTRWHEDDLAGRILASDDGPNWTVVNLPALAETQADRDHWAEAAGEPIGRPDPLGRSPGQALCPERYDEATLQSIRLVNPRGFESLYQGHPTLAAGDMFQRSWFTIVQAVPAGSTWVRYWDKAGTQGGGCYSAGVLMARSPDGAYYVADVIRGQWSAAGREAVIKSTAEMDGRHVAVWVEQEPGSSGKESAGNTVVNLAGFVARAEQVTGDKVYRAGPLAAQAEVGNVRLVKAPWNRAFVDELCAFPSGKYKDQVDAASGAFNKLVLSPRPSRSQAAGGHATLSPFPTAKSGIPGAV